MKIKTINAVICKKIDQWVASIEDEAVRNQVKPNIIVTGGCITSMLLREKINDFDIYFTDKKTVKAVAEYYVKQFNKEHDGKAIVLDGADKPPVIEDVFDRLDRKWSNMDADRVKIFISSAGVAGDSPETIDENDAEAILKDVLVPETPTKEQKSAYRPVFLSSNAITLSDKIQLVIRFYGDPAQIHDNYDYAHCTNYWTSKERKVVTNIPALESILTKELVYIGSKYPLASIIRTKKFLARGFTLNAGQILKMSYQVSRLDLNNPDVLEDQLVGVDFAFFSMLINVLNEQIEKEKSEGREFRLDYGYLATLIDKIF